MAKNPKTCVAIAHATQQIYVENQLVLYDKTDEEPAPMMIYHDKYARFIMTIINKCKDESGNKNKAGSANLKPSEIPGIIARSRYSLNKHMDALYFNTDANDEDVSIAYSVRFIAGSLKGKSPADVLLEDPEKGVNTLTAQYKWLQSNLAKYPKNQALMDSISEAVHLFRAEKLNAKAASSSNLPVITIYKSGPRPLIRKAAEGGESPVKEMDIKYFIGEKAPVYIEVRCYKAHVKKEADGRLKVLDKNDVSRYFIYLSIDEWEHILKVLSMCMRTFEDTNARTLYSEATKLEIQQRREYEQQNSERLHS